jgi:predicted DsbA family dithiol-disulfide isomerase
VRLDIYSDPICPWCLIGKAQLDRALEAAPAHPFEIAWHPFQLNPDMPAGGMERRSYLEAKFAGREGAIAAYRPVLEAAEAAGLALDLGAIDRVPNTLDAHRLIHWAGIEGRQTLAVAALFRGYFRDGRDIGDPAVLAELGAEAGLDRALVARLLASDADRDTIRTRDAEARARGIRAVPTFILAETYVMTGAQPATLWSQVTAEIAEAAPR